MYSLNFRIVTKITEQRIAISGKIKKTLIAYQNTAIKSLTNFPEVPDGSTVLTTLQTQISKHRLLLLIRFDCTIIPVFLVNIHFFEYLPKKRLVFHLITSYTMSMKRASFTQYRYLAKFYTKKEYSTYDHQRTFSRRPI